MEITIRFIDGCPNFEKAEERVREALRLAGADANVQPDLVATQEDAERLAFSGSPTILFDGRDPFAPSVSRPALACRVYPTDCGLEGAPSVAQLRKALEATLT